MNRHNPHAQDVIRYEEAEDERLMLAYAAGDEKAFEVLYLRYRTRAFGYLSARVNDPRVVDELFQKVFMKLHRSRERFEPGRLFPAWFFTICRNVVIDELRSRQRAPLERQLDANHPAKEPLETPHELDSILETLPERQQEAIRLRYREELDFEEIATKLNTTSQNVRQLISRAVRKLRSMIGKP